MENPPPSTSPATVTKDLGNRFHGLDALRAFALLLGIVFHAALSFVLPPGQWAVGTNQPSHFLLSFVYYAHCFRMEIFFLLSGFFARLVVEKRGVGAFARDRFKRIFLVFVVFLFPLKILLAGMFIWGGLKTGWLILDEEIASYPLPVLAIGAQFRTPFPHISPAHLWFLYYLSWFLGIYLGLRSLMNRLSYLGILSGKIQSVMTTGLKSFWSPLLLSMLVAPWILLMDGYYVETPDKSLVLNLKVFGLYGTFFLLGVWSETHRVVLYHWARFWKLYLPMSFLVALGILFLGIPNDLLPGRDALGQVQPALAPPLMRGVLTTLTIGFAVPGWIGLFLATMDRPNDLIRYLADSSYWLYLIHLPVVVFFQVAFSGWSAPWWIQWPLINLLSFPIMLASYHWLVRSTWLGFWLNGQRK